MSLAGELNITHVLRGKITSLGTINAPDKTLCVDGASADSKATGDAINAVKTDFEAHANSNENPHAVTKAQVGLGDVDNTADIEKPVSKAQAEAIAEAKKAGTDAQANLDLALLNLVSKEENKGLSTNDFTNEEKEKLAGIEAGANMYELGENAVTADKIADGAVSKSLTITLSVANWSNKEQTVTANGVTDSNTVIISPTPENHQAYGEAQIRCTAQGANSLTFTCEEVPTTEITVNVCCINK